MDFLNKLYSKYGTSEIHIEDAITQMGHSPTSSTAGRVLASMFSFGLLDSRGSGNNKFVRISRLAQEILLEDENSPHRYELLQKAALTDGSMQAVWDKWGVKIPVEDTIKKSLQLEMNYSPGGAKRFATVVSETYTYAKLADTTFVEPSQEEQGEESREESIGMGKKLPSSVRKANLLLPGANREILIYAPSDLTDLEFELIFKWLELQKYGLVSQEKKDGSNEQEQKEDNQ